MLLDTNTKLNKHNEILKNKKANYKLSLDKKYLRDEKKLMKIDKNNEFEIESAKIKNNNTVFILRAGRKIAKVCIILTIISCFLTIGGNLENFIMNIPLDHNESPSDYILTWASYNGNKVEYTRFNLITTIIYIPFIIGLQIILYQISLNLYNIKSKFNRYYIHAIFLQYSMLFYSVYSNYKFLSRYTRPVNFGDMFITFIPSLLLDLSCIFFLVLAQDKKSLNYHDSKGEIKDVIKAKIYKLKGLSVDKLKAKITAKKNKKNRTESIDTVSVGRDFKGEKKDVINKDKVEIKGEININKTDEKGINKTKEKDIKEYILRLKEKGENKINITELKEKCKIDKNKWAKIKPELLKENLIYLSENKRITYIK